MSSLGSILSIARSAIFAHQTAIRITSQNVSNAATDGYSRQRAVLRPTYPALTPDGMIGTGVGVATVERVRDALLDESYRRETGNAAGFGLRRDLLGQVEAVFGEPSTTGLASTLDAFWSSWADLANNPDSAPARAAVQQRGSQVATTLRTFASRLDATDATTRSRLADSVARFNDLAGQVAELNREIVAGESAGHTAGDLRDVRDRLIDEMAGIGAVRVLERSNGGVAVLLDGIAVVDGTSVNRLDVRAGNPYATPPTAYALRFARADGTFSSPLASVSGALGTMLDVLNTEVPTARAKLDALARGIVTEVNALHRRGWTEKGDTYPGSTANWPPSPGPTGSMVNFFNPATTGSRDIALSAQVASDPSFIAAGYTRDAVGDNALALDLARFRDKADAIPTWSDPAARTSFATFYRDLVTGVGIDVSAAESSATVAETLASQADTRRQSVSGVSTDEELIQLIRHQQAYTAATRLVSVVDEMAQSVINMV